MTLVDSSFNSLVRQDVAFKINQSLMPFACYECVVIGFCSTVVVPPSARITFRDKRVYVDIAAMLSTNFNKCKHCLTMFALTEASMLLCTNKELFIVLRVVF